ncbi:MAG TPA: divalent metal cation transporter [Candidatus Paceibacterota bacterium]|nr:divalent metal cation transporter [Candidatus Paceibacterota bacterium]
MFDPKRWLRRFFESPAELLGRTIDSTRRGEHKFFNKAPLRLAEEYFHNLGPGLTTGAADDDPSGIGTYSQTGARYGFQLLWLSLFTFPFMAIVQEMCARIGLVSGHGLAANIRRHYSPGVLYVVCGLLFLANTLNIAADLGAMAASTRLLFPSGNLLLLVVGFAIFSMLLQIYTTYARYARILKWMSLALLSYVFSAFAVHLDWHSALAHTLVPTLTFSRAQLFLLCAILGTTISPYLFFWQTSQEVEEQHRKNGPEHVARIQEEVHDEGVLRSELRRMRIDVWSGMFLSNLVMFFIIAACAATLYAHGITTIATAAEAARAIRPFGGELTYFFFSFGIVGTGLLAVPVLAGSSAYAIAESFGWQRGLYHKLTQAYAFYGVIIVSMLVAVAADALGLDPIKGLIYAAVANGLIAPVVLFFIVRISSRMKHHPNRPLTTAMGWFITGLMALSGVAAIASLF